MKKLLIALACLGLAAGLPACKRKDDGEYREPKHRYKKEKMEKPEKGMKKDKNGGMNNKGMKQSKEMKGGSY